MEEAVPIEAVPRSDSEMSTPVATIPQAQATFRMGEHVKARLAPDEALRIGQIVAVHRNGLFDVAFDDQQRPREGLDLPPELIVKLEAVDATPPLHPAESPLDPAMAADTVGATLESGSSAPQPMDAARTYTKGEQVEALREGGDIWRLAVISHVDGSGPTASYDVTYSDHFTETDLPSRLVRPLLDTPSTASTAPTGSGWAVGQRCEARYHGGRLHYSGRITAVATDGATVSLLYDDGDIEDGVPVEFVRSAAEMPPLSSPAPHSASSTAEPGSEPPPSTAAYRVGDKVEGNFQGRGKWYPGSVSRVRGVLGVAKYGVQYNDGDVEDNVPEDMLRPPRPTLRTPVAPSVSSPSRPNPQKHRRLSGEEGAAARPKVSPRPGDRLQDAKLGPPPRQLTAEDEARLLAELRVEANAGGLGVWLPARIVAEREEVGEVDLLYDNGQREDRVPLQRVRLMNTQGRRPAPPSSGQVASDSPHQPNEGGEEDEEEDEEDEVRMRETQLAVCPGALVEVRQGGKWQLARVLHVYYEGHDERYNLRLTQSQQSVRGVSLRDMRLPRTAVGQRREDTEHSAGLLRTDEVAALRCLLRSKDSPTDGLLGGAVQSLFGDGLGIVTQSDVRALRQEVHELKNVVGLLAHKLASVADEVARARRTED